MEPAPPSPSMLVAAAEVAAVAADLLALFTGVSPRMFHATTSRQLEATAATAATDSGLASEETVVTADPQDLSTCSTQQPRRLKELDLRQVLPVLPDLEQLGEQAEQAGKFKELSASIGGISIQGETQKGDIVL